jgi:hypothetical protein
MIRYRKTIGIIERRPFSQGIASPSKIQIVATITLVIMVADVMMTYPSL